MFWNLQTLRESTDAVDTTHAVIAATETTLTHSDYLCTTWKSFLQPSTSLWWWLTYDIIQKLERHKQVLSNWHGRGKSPPKMPLFHKDFPIVLMNPPASTVANLSVRCMNKKGLFIELHFNHKIESHHILYCCTLNDTVVAICFTLITVLGSQQFW